MTDVGAPVHGAVRPLTDVPDPVFSGEVVGSGVAVDPASDVDGEVVAVSPVAGTLSTVHPHAFVVLADDGTGVLVHLGIDTVQLEGEGFTLLAEKGERVDAGAPVVRWDPAAVTAGGRSAIVPVVVMDTAAGSVRSDALGSTVRAGDVLFSVHGPTPR